MLGGPLAMVAHRRAVVGHPSKILLVVTLRPEVIRSPPLRIVVVPEREGQHQLAAKSDPVPPSHSPRACLRHSRLKDLGTDTSIIGNW